MKFPLFFIIIFLFSCSNHKDFQLTKSNVTVKNENDTLKLYIDCIAEGYKIDEFKGGIFSKLSFKLDIKNPNGKIDTTVQSGVVDQVARKGILDTPIKTKYSLPQNIVKGNYILIIKVKDEFSSKYIKVEKPFIINN